MFFPDVDLSVKEFVRVAKPGGRVCTAVWDAPEESVGHHDYGHNQ